MGERKLATIRRIAEVKEIIGADTIEAVRVDGWWVVAKKGEYEVGQLATYLEVDSWVPTDIAPFLTKAGHEPKEYKGIKGERLRTIKLRGQISQGLLLPIEQVFPEKDSNYYWSMVGEDITELLGVLKWERPISPQLYGQVKGNFPSFLRKTDQERVQNIGRTLESYNNEAFEVTIKLDGSSCTIFVNEENDGVCSRNLELKQNEDNAFWRIALDYDIHKKIRAYGKNVAVQGELIAPNIQSNYEKVTKPEFYVFDVFDIDKQEYMLPKERQEFCKLLDIPHVPIIDKAFTMVVDVDKLLDMAEGDGMNKGVKREGLVFKHNSSSFSFKAISNSYLLKEK
jgi:RNA ligase (TIGR02306 family)